MRTLLTFSPNLYHHVNMHISLNLLESHMFEGVCCDKVYAHSFYINYKRKETKKKRRKKKKRRYSSRDDECAAVHILYTGVRL